MKIDQIKFSVAVVFFCIAAYFLIFDSVSSGKSVGLLHFQEFNSILFSKKEQGVDRYKNNLIYFTHIRVHRSHCNVFLFVYILYVIRFHPQNKWMCTTNIQFTRRAHIICMCKIITKQREERKIQVTHELCIIQSTNKTRTYIYIYVRLTAHRCCKPPITVTCGTLLQQLNIIRRTFRVNSLSHCVRIHTPIYRHLNKEFI